MLEAQKLRFQGAGPLRCAAWPFLAWAKVQPGLPRRQHSRPGELCRAMSRVPLFIMDSLDGFIGTFSGLRFWPLLPNPADILIADIAHALAHQCRFGGHASKFYSVAEHSVHVSDEFEGLGDRDHVVHPGRDRKRLDFMAASTAAHCRNDGALGPTRDVRLESSFADALNDVVDLLFGSAVGHVHNHGDDPSIGRQKQKPRFSRGFGGILELSLLPW